MSKVLDLKQLVADKTPVILARPGDTHGSTGIITKIIDSTETVVIQWLLTPSGVPYERNRQSTYSFSAVSPKLLDVTDPIPRINRPYAFIFPLQGCGDIEKMVERHRINAKREREAIETNFFMIAAVHPEQSYDVTIRNDSRQPPLKKYVDFDEAVAIAEEMASKYEKSFVVLGVAAVVKPKSLVETATEVETVYRDGFNNLLGHNE